MFKSKLSRLLCLLFSCIFCFVSFGVGVNAADDENLIDSNLHNWDMLPEFESTTTVLGADTGVQTISIRPQKTGNPDADFGFAIGGLYDISSSYKAGDTYKLTFEFLEANRYIGGGVGIISREAFLEYNAGLQIGLASYNNNSYTAIENCYIEIYEANYLDYVDSTITLSFEMPSGIVNPCIFINFVCINPDIDLNQTCWISFRNFSFVNESESDEDGLVNKLLNGIVGLFVPSDDYFDNLTEQVQDMFSNSFGFVYDVTVFFTDLMNKLSDLISANAGNEFKFTLPAQEFDINLVNPDGVALSNHHIKLWNDITLDFSFLETISGLSILYNLYRISLHMICLFFLLEYARKTFDKVMA